MYQTVIDKIDLLNQTLETLQKWQQQHPEFYKGQIFYISVSIELFEQPDFYTYLFPFCEQLRLSLSILNQDVYKKRNEITITKNMVKIKQMGVSTLNFAT